MKKEALIKMTGLRKRYGKESPEILKGVDLEVYPGQIIGYIGPNGAGKSTTIKILLGIIEDYEGEVSIFGKDIKEDPVNYKKRIGYVPETADIYDNLTGSEYITFLGSVYGMDYQESYDKGCELMKLFEVDDYYNARISSYSKGMKQKLLIVASLFHNPDILFFDEPLSGMDANSVMIFKEILVMLAKEGKTVFYSSHIMEVVEKISERILLINDGIIVADGSFDDLKASNYENSLEEIFNKMTGFNQHREIAENFVKVIVKEQDHGFENA